MFKAIESYSKLIFYLTNSSHDYKLEIYAIAATLFLYYSSIIYK